MQDLDKKLIGWGRQTILFAISLTAQSAGESANEAKQAEDAMKATDKICKELWDAARKQATTAHELGLIFTRSVFDWVKNHLSD